MRKITLVLLVCLFILSGCRVNRKNIESLITQTIDEAILLSLPASVNMNKKLMSYYLQPSIGKIESTQTNSVFKISSNYVILNIDVAAVISRKYYSTGDATELREIDAFSDLVMEKEGSFPTATNIVRNYRYRLYQLSNDRYGILLQTSNLIVVAIVPTGDAINVTTEIFLLVRSCRIDEEAVVENYSQKEMIDYQKETLELFEKMYPTEGLLIDMNDDY